MKDGADARTQLELALVKAAEPELEPSVKALLARLERLDGRAGAAAPRRAEPATRRPRTARPPRRAAGPPPAPARHAAAARPARAAPAARRHRRRPPPRSAPAPSPPPPSRRRRRRGRRAGAPAPSSSVADALDLRPRGALAAVLERSAERPLLAARSGRAPRAADGELTLAWPESSAFLKRKAEDPANREPIAAAIRAVTGSSLRLAYELRADDEPPRRGRAASREDELVERFKDEFDAEEPPKPEEQT